MTQTTDTKTRLALEIVNSLPVAPPFSAYAIAVVTSDGGTAYSWATPGKDVRGAKRELIKLSAEMIQALQDVLNQADQA